MERDGELVGLPLEEYLLDETTRPVRSYDDKLAPDDGGGLRLVAKDNPEVLIVDVDDPVTARVWDAARRCHVALGCRDYSLFDFRIDPTGVRCSSRRASTAPSRPPACSPVMAAAGGIALDELLATAVTGALKRR